MNSRRAVWRWGWRMLRKQWREQLLILALVFGSVALSVGGTLLAYNTAPPEAALNERSVMYLEAEDEAGLERVVASLSDRLGALDNGEASAAGAADAIELRASDPAHPQTSGLIALLDGIFPSGQSEAAVTRGASNYLAVEIGETIELDGIAVEVVGIVEDPTELAQDFVFLDHRDPAPFELERSYVSSEGSGSVDDAFVRNNLVGGISSSETQSSRSILTVVSAIVTTLAMMMVGLIVSASFAVVGRRRVRQYGLLGAIGANEKHLRGAAAFNGFSVGLVAGVAGVVAGIVAARAALPLIENSLSYRVEFELQWTIVFITLALAVVMSTIAAWWPARAIARQPIVEALAARRPHARSPRNTTLAGLILTIGGFFTMVTTIRTDGPTAPPLIAMVGIIIGVLLLSPAFVLMIGKLTSRAALPVRIAGRDLSRFQGRAAAALASIVLVLAIPVGTGMVTASNDSRDQATTNVPPETAIVWASGTDLHDSGVGIGPDFVSLDDATLLADISQALPNSTAVPIEVFVDQNPEERFFGDTEPARQGFFQVDCDDGNYATGDDDDEWCFQTVPMWVATPALLDLWSLDLAGADMLTERSEPVRRRVAPKEQDAAFDLATEFPEQTSKVVELPDYHSFPDVLIAEDAVLPTDKRVTIGWLLTSDAPLTVDEVATLRSLMNDGTDVETLTTPDGKGNTRLVVALVGMLVGFAVLAATVTLIRGESADDIRVLDVLGASSRMRRSVAAATAALLAFAGALLAIPIGAIGLVVDNLGPERNFIFAVPWVTVIILFLAFPLLAAVGSGLLSPNPKEIR